MMSTEFGTGRTVFVLAIVVGCFAVLWPKVFYPMLVSSHAPQTSSYQDETPMRSERPTRHIAPDMLHPALREKTRVRPEPTRPRRTIDAHARPGPMPGVRPPMGGGGGAHMGTSQPKGNTMSVIMPLYTVGIIIFFIYTIIKVVVKKPAEEDASPRIKDFHMDPEHRKYVFAEEYVDQRRERRERSSRRSPAQPPVQKRPTAPAAAVPVEPSKDDQKIAEPTNNSSENDEQMEALRKRLEETEKAMERLMSQMGSVSDKLTEARVTEGLRQTTSGSSLSKDSTPDMDEYEVISKESSSSGSQEEFNTEKEAENVNPVEGSAEVAESSTGTGDPDPVQPEEEEEGDQDKKEGDQEEGEEENTKVVLDEKVTEKIDEKEVADDINENIVE